MAKPKTRPTWNIPQQERRATPAAPAQISQCMIVKNEESNIEKALTWGQGIVLEQIVVDTGSTDRTVEIARSMGATVYDFEWINDFSAAKNFAIEQAKGNWIAFLDADEYMLPEDAQKMHALVSELQQHDVGLEYFVITSAMFHLNDAGAPFQLAAQSRLFRNHPNLRYHHPIHEQLEYRGYNPPKKLEFDARNHFTIMHTGYSDSAFVKTNKAQRNKEMLLREIEKHPDNYELKAYLMDVLLLQGNFGKAINIGNEVLKAPPEAQVRKKETVYQNMIRFMLSMQVDHEVIHDYARRAMLDYPKNPDFMLYRATALLPLGYVDEALTLAVRCEETVKDGHQGGEYYVYNEMPKLYKLRLDIATRQHNAKHAVEYAVKYLQEKKKSPDILTALIRAFNQDGYSATPEDILGVLEQIYDLYDVEDKLLLLRAAKDADNTALARLVLEQFTKEERTFLQAP